MITDSKNWQYKLREGVKFHNGEPWNAESAKAGIDQNGEVSNSSQSFSYHGAITGEVVDEFTVQIVCATDCPVLPRSTIFSRFQAPEWYAASPAPIWDSFTDRESSQVTWGAATLWTVPSILGRPSAR